MSIEDTTLSEAEQLKQTMKACFASTAIFAKTFFPEKFKRGFSAQHYELFDILDDDSVQKASIVSHRGFGKSSIIGMAFPAKRILFQQSKFIIVIAHNQTNAVEFTEALKSELEFNPYINKIFGAQRSDRWSMDSWETTGGTKVVPLGAGQQIRGKLYKNQRPDLILFDDIETKELVRNPERRDFLLRWIMSDVCNSVDLGSSSWRVLGLGNMLHFDSLMVRLGESRAWVSKRFPVCDQDFRPNWPEFMNREQIERMADEYRAEGKFDEFCLEFMCLPISTEDAVFKQDMFSYFEEADLLKQSSGKDGIYLESVVIVDPAKTTELTSCDTAIVCLSVDLRNNNIYVRDIDSGKMHPDDIIKRAFTMAARYNARTIGVEVTGLNEFITYPIYTLMMRERRTYEIVELKARGDKDDRISALGAFYKRGLIKHNRSNCRVLEGQLLAHPKSPKKDVADATAYIVEMLSMGLRYFHPIEKYDKKTLAEEYAKLKNEPPINNWRYV